jgi:hypothetical protein
VEIPELVDATKAPSSGRWGTNTLNLLKNPTSASLDVIKEYVSDTMQYTLLIVPWEGYDGDLMALLIAHARAMLLGVYLLL